MQKKKNHTQKAGRKPDLFEVVSPSFESVVFQRIVEESIKESGQEPEGLDRTDEKIANPFKEHTRRNQERN